jgi:hypothetical protein
MKKFLIYGIVLLFVLTTCEQVQDSGNVNGLDNSSTGTEEKLFAITSDSSGHLNKGGTRQFTVKPKHSVTWTVEGNTDSGTAITGLTATRGNLKVGKEETNRTLTIKATSVEDPEAFSTVSVTVDGVPAVWTELTDNLAGLITNTTNGLMWFGVWVDDATHGIRVLAYGDEVDTGAGKGRWVVGGGSDYHESYTPIVGNRYPVMAYSDDDGQTWEEIHTITFLYEELPECLIYDGPADDKKFILSTRKGSVFWSSDGITWKRVPSVLPGYAPTDSISYMRQVIYGDIDRADGGKGIYLVRGERGRYTWSYDGKTWEKHYADTAWEYAYVATKAGVGPGSDSMSFLYGTGIIGGKRVKMFFGEGHNNEVGAGRIYCYSLNGETWANLAEDKAASVRFVPAPPAGANRSLSWKDEVDISALNFASDTAVYTYGTQSSTLTEGPGVRSHADFVAYGNDKYLAVGKGRRLAWTDAEMARKK